MNEENIKKIISQLFDHKIDFGQLLLNSLDYETKDLLEQLLTDRISYFTKERAEKNPEQSKEEWAQFCKWKEVLTEKYPGIEKEGEEFLDWQIACQGREIEDVYRFGLKDGIRIMKSILSI